MNPSSLPKFSPRRALGRTGFVATAIGAGDLADRSQSVDQCAATLRLALDAGLNLVDTAPAYEDGYSEQVVGAAVRGRRYPTRISSACMAAPSSTSRSARATR